MKKYNTKMIMKRAWRIAKSAVKKFGGKAKQYFAEAMKMAWAEAKRTEEVLVPSWFIRKQTGERYSAKYVKAYVEKETEKAVLVDLGFLYFWCPKSILG